MIGWSYGGNNDGNYNSAIFVAKCDPTEASAGKTEDNSSVFANRAYWEFINDFALRTMNNST
eukprot:5707504-Ditylum_brightwellii.AAC.1